MKSKVLMKASLAAGLLAGSLMAATKPSAFVPQSDAQNVQSNLLAYRDYSIFDFVDFSMANGRVTLNGEVTQPYKKSDMEKIVAKLPGVEGVTNNIQVLPVSQNDDQLRQQVASSIFLWPGLSIYGAETHPTIHIIVDDGHVTLAGLVNNQTDKDAATVRAAAAGMSFGPIVNNLQVAQSS